MRLNPCLSYYYVLGNILYRAAAKDDENDPNKLLDGDLSTYLEDTSSDPYLRVQLKKSITIDKADITLIYGNYII